MERTLLVILAHPDDESFGLGGTLARYASEGVNVHLICATRGESGKITDPAIDPDTPKGPLREAELHASCEALGIHPPILLDYHDSGRLERSQDANPHALMNADDLEVEKILLKHIADIRPDVLITFDPHGIYGHIDHIKIQRASEAAFWSAGSVMQPAPRRLFYAVMGSKQMQTLKEARDTSTLSELDAGIYGVSDDSFACVMDVSAFATQKEASVRSHRSQVGPNSPLAGFSKDNDMWQAMFTHEYLSLGGLRGSFPEMPVDDIFAGLD
jgi:N-acetyl-1-D-myo-inositol-2-amino-2-deoxy-alpha-D-glucopyranoside deacetylase